MSSFSFRIYRSKDRLSPFLVTENTETLVEHLLSHAGAVSRKELLATMEYALELWVKHPGKMQHIPLNRHCGLRISSNLLED